MLTCSGVDREKAKLLVAACLAWQCCDDDDDDDDCMHDGLGSVWCLCYKHTMAGLNRVMSSHQLLWAGFAALRGGNRPCVMQVVTVQSFCPRLCGGLVPFGLHYRPSVRRPLH